MEGGLEDLVVPGTNCSRKLSFKINKYLNISYRYQSTKVNDGAFPISKSWSLLGELVGRKASMGAA